MKSFGPNPLLMVFLLLIGLVSAGPAWALDGRGATVHPAWEYFLLALVIGATVYAVVICVRAMASPRLS